MAQGRKYPQKFPLKVRVIRREAGENRHYRRMVEARARGAYRFSLKLSARKAADFMYDQIQSSVERRVLRATTRRMEREAAKISGLPVKYSIA